MDLGVPFFSLITLRITQNVQTKRFRGNEIKAMGIEELLKKAFGEEAGEEDMIGDIESTMYEIGGTGYFFVEGTAMVDLLRNTHMGARGSNG